MVNEEISEKEKGQAEKPSDSEAEGGTSKDPENRIPAAPPEIDLISKANESAKKLNEENNRFETLLKKQEKLLAEAKLQGRSMAGESSPGKSEEMKKKEDAMEFFKGTDISKAIERHG